MGLQDMKKELFLQSDWKTNIITKNIDQWKGHFSHRLKKELTNTDSKKECLLPLAGKYWKTVVQKEEKNWLFLTNQDTKNSQKLSHLLQYTEGKEWIFFTFLCLYHDRPFIGLIYFNKVIEFNNDSSPWKTDLLIFKLLLCSYTEPSIWSHDSERIFKK